MRASPRPLFHITADAMLPAAPGMAMVAPRDPLALLLEELLEAADCSIIPPPALAPDGPSATRAFAALRRASAFFEVAAGASLADHFWTHGSALRSGEVAARLRATARCGRPVQGFLALYATDICSSLLYSPNAMPVRVRTRISFQGDAGGPFLALIACEADPVGRVQAIAGHALPIYHGRRFMPVRSPLDRDVLRALEHLQVALDAHGIECWIQRARFPQSEAAARYNIRICVPGKAERQFMIAVDPGGLAGDDSAPPADFLVDAGNWANGTFIAWLTRTVSG
ncbi:hypothetical protein [Sphingobium sp. TKS]|uniref:hypothetical protein n=1 Tax=Sphingobium sp. TKS TaxID=1315974 RepID=UPI0007706A8F|nr:hypothetical protein [Sphingobium sp. TKS]AMK26112.1 hypothetical protein K426_26065 [Sphingobium sp. TKS]